MRNLLLTFALLLTFSLSYGQIKVVSSPSGYTGIGPAFSGTTPAQQLDVDGNVQVRGNSADGAKLEIGGNRTSDGEASFELIADQSAFPDWGFRFLRYPNGFTNIDHRGTQSVVFNLSDGTGAFYFSASGSPKFFVQADRIQTSQSAYKPGGGSWTAISDRRTKDSVRKFKYGLSDVLKINPVYYTYNGKADTPTDKEFVGVIAQEIQEVAPFMVNSFIHEDVNKTVKEEYLAVDDTAIKYMLINAIKEHQEMIDAKDAQIANLEERLVRIEEVLAQQVTTTVQSIELRDARLGQNTPNPFNEVTSINYTVPTKTSNAVVQIYDMNGRLLKAVNVSKGNGTLELNAGELTAGTYTYHLVIDGNVVDTKKMVLTK